jgi:hypothetical protein
MMIISTIIGRLVDSKMIIVFYYFFDIMEFFKALLKACLISIRMKLLN